MYKYLTKNGQLLAFGFGILITVLFYVIASSGLEEFNMLDEKARPGSEEGNIFMFGLYAAVTLLVIAALSMLLFGLFQMVTDWKGALKGVIGIGAIVVIFFIAYTMAEAAPPTSNVELYQRQGITEGISKYVSAAITCTGVLAAIAVASFALSEIRNFFK
jgi:hypothetical protein